MPVNIPNLPGMSVMDFKETYTDSCVSLRPTPPRRHHFHGTVIHECRDAPQADAVSLEALPFPGGR